MQFLLEPVYKVCARAGLSSVVGPAFNLNCRLFASSTQIYSYTLGSEGKELATVLEEIGVVSPSSVACIPASWLM